MNTRNKEMHPTHMIFNFGLSDPNKMPLNEAIENDYLMQKSERHRLTTKYDILRSLVPLVNNYFVTMEEDEIN